ncbi:chemotaxis protein methyltransferase [mine drainage metagenome]|uniref:protein-glutamate O-methyltransferase n=1 Tax=mine drainage metagenome TaxID=410659 RepID=A0A1J5SNG8_9ZZZZ
MRHPKTPPVEAKPAPVKARKIDTGFHVVGIGASAGGLEAFEQFFRSIPPDSGMAFVLVSHLDPDHDSMLTEILQRTTSMPVVEAQDHVKVEPNCVYVLPPNREMAIFHRNLQLSTPEMPRGQRMVIDSFLRSLAEDQGEKAVGIILSGTGTDGTLGLRAIQGAGGITLVQDPATAKYDGMPVSAIQAGYASYTLPVEKMPAQLLNNRLKLSAANEAAPSPAAENSLSRILMLLRSGTGNDFSLYKKSTIGRRIERRMSQHNIDDMDTYARYLKEHPPEVQSLFKELLINVTSFFRDPEAFVVLKQNILPELLKNKPEHYVFRVWVAGCATGEEAYSIAILLHELMGENEFDFKTQIYSTDLDDDAIAVARAGVYPPNIAQDVTPERLRRFFVKEDAGYRVKKEIREMVVFATQNIIKDPPFTKLDLLSCRNLMIYLEPELQNRVIPAFHYALKPGGVLFLSPSESIGNHVELFTALNRKWKFYQTTPSIASTRTVMSSGLSWTKDNPTKGPDDVTTQIKETDFAELTRRALLQSYAPASVVINTKGDILFVHGDTGKYLRPAPGQATLNVIEMAREGLQLELRTAIQATIDKGIPTLNREATFGSDGNILRVSFSVRLLPFADIGRGLLLVSFQDVMNAKPEKAAAESSAMTGKSARGKRAAVSAEQLHIEELERDLTYTKENLHATIEEQQASNEELKSANEEMQSTNEELQSTNEELETSKEELQSVNEELVTVNAELQNKIEQLAGMQNDMKNLLDNINVGTVFLNDTLNIKRFTREAVQVYRLVSSDVGRPLGDIKSNIKDDDLLADAQAVLDTLVPREREVSTASGAWYQARIQPYRTLDNVIDGVVLTFTDITKRMLAETATKDARELSESIVNTVHEPLIVLDGTCRIILASSSFYDSFKVSPQDTVGRQLYELGNRQWDIPKLRELLESLLPGNQVIEGFEVEHDFPVIGKRKMLLNARRITGKAEGTPLILLAIEEVK